MSYSKQLEEHIEQLQELLAKEQATNDWLWHRPRYYYELHINYTKEHGITGLREEITRSVAHDLIKRKFTVDMPELPNYLPWYMFVTHAENIQQGFMIAHACIRVQGFTRVAKDEDGTVYMQETFKEIVLFKGCVL
jgi:hypothetical protein